MGPDIHRNISNQTLKSFNGYSAGFQKNYSTRPESRIRQIWRNADAVCFDVDSTVCKDEAIDELAAYLGKGAEVAACTQRAMNGSMSFREALRLRLEVMQPNLSEVRNYAETHEIALTPGIIELIENLHNRGTDVYLVSGGFRPLIIPVAQRLGIPINRIYANEILYHEDGSYAGFDINELTSDSGNVQIGKAGVCGLLKKLHGYNKLVMIGDGATDAEACPPADAFIGFGGNQVREAVRQQAGWYVYDFETLNSELDNTE